MNCYLTYILGISLLFINFISTRSVGKLSNDDKKIKKGDNYYLIYVNNEHGEYKVYPDSDLQKREESQVFIESLVDEINNLIIENKDSYENPEKLEEIEESSQIKRRKRNEESQKVYFYDESDFVYPISSVNNRVVLKGYLSEKLAKELPSKFESIISCDPDEDSFKINYDNYFNRKEILEETKWKKLNVRQTKIKDEKNFNGHLALISQGQFLKNNTYFDKNYYYPNSAGLGVNLVFLDSSFNFDYSEFDNNKERETKCVGIVKDARVSLDVSQGCDISKCYHGETTSEVAAGLLFGVANRANVYGLALTEAEYNRYFMTDIINGLQYIYEHMIEPHNTVINISIGGLFPKTDSYYTQFKEITEKITKKGGIIVASAGNESYNLDEKTDVYLPCDLDDVICVGGIDNRKDSYRFSYKKAFNSNYGKPVDIYAPFNAIASYKINNSIKTHEVHGTSYSSPIVAGIIATIIGENRNIKYTKESMLEQLKKNGKDLTVGLPNGKTGILANNGKRSVYYNTECSGQELGYSCCDTCQIASKEKGSFYGIDNDWCGIKYSCETINNEWYGQESGYPACSECKIEFEDKTGKFGVENGNWCGIRFSC